MPLVISGASSGQTTLAATDAVTATITLPSSAGTIATAESTLAQFNASGSAPVYACRAWVNFNGTGTVAIRASGNVSSITDNGTGDYTVNFTTAMQDANYITTFSSREDDASLTYGDQATYHIRTESYSDAGSIRFRTGTTSTNYDHIRIMLSIFR